MEDVAHAHAVGAIVLAKPRISLLVLSAAALFTWILSGGAGYAHASTSGVLGPFGQQPKPTLNPFGLAQAQPANEASAQTPTTPTQAGLVACTADEQCPDQTICTDGACRPLERPLRVLLFRKEGPKTAFWPFYFSRTGSPGYRVVAPLYWHFWSANDKAQVVAPFYFRFHDYKAQKTSTAVWLGPLITWSKQPDASSWGVWPLIYRSTKFGWAAPLLGSFKYASPDEGHAWGVYAFLYYWRRHTQNQEATDVVFPLVWSFRSEAKATTVGFPLLWSFRRADTTHTLLLPLLYRRSDQRNKLTITPFGYGSWAGANQRGSHLWIYWYARNKKGDNHDVLFPLLWSFRSPKSNATVVFPLVWHFGDPKGHTTVAGPYVDVKSASSRFRAVVPLFFSNSNVKEKSHWGVLFPLAFWNSSNDGDEAFALTPLGSYARNRKAGTSGLTIWLPPIVTRRSPQSRMDLVFPFYYRSEDRVAQSQSLWALLFYRGQDPDGSTTTLFPLFWRFHDTRNQASATLLFPLFFRRNAPNDNVIAAGLGVMGYYRNRGADGSSAGLFPLAFFGRHHDKRHAVVFPLLWHFSSKDRSSTLALPLFGHWRSKYESTTAIFPLLYVQGKSAESSYRFQFPLYWYFHNHETQSRTHVLGPGFYSSKPQGWSAGLFPLLFAGRSDTGRHVVVAPLVWHFRNHAEDRGRTLVGPYYHASHGQQITDALFPLLYYRRGAKPGGQNETSFTLFPLVHFHRTPTTQLFVTPLAAGKRTPERKAGFVGPYFWYESSTVAASGLLPVWWDLTNKQTQQRTRVLGPWVAIDQPDTRARFVFPFWGHYQAQRQNVREQGTYVFPTYFRQRNSDGYALDALVPLFWRSKSPELNTLQVGPYFSRTTRQNHVQGLLPFYIYQRNDQRSWLFTPVGYRHHDFRSQEATTWMSLLFYRNSTPRGHRTVLFPLWYSGRRNESFHQVLFPLLWRFGNDQKQTSTTFLGPLFARRNGGMKTYGVFPLAWFGRDATKSASSVALLPLFYRSHAPDRQALLTPVFGRGRSPQSSWWYVPPVYRRVTPTTALTTIFPLGFQHSNQATETTTRFILPLLHFSRSSPDRALSSWLGVLWHRRSIAASTNVLFPLFFDHHSFHDSRTTALLPLFIRHERAADRTAYTFAPLFYRRTSPADSTTTLFPIYWDFKGEGTRTQFLFPLFANIERASWKGTYVFPNIWYRRGKGPDAGTSRLFVFPLWESEVKRPGDHLWEVLLGLAGYERAGRNRFVKLFFIPFEISPVPRTNQASAWYGKAPRQKTLPPGRGFSGHIW